MVRESYQSMKRGQVSRRDFIKISSAFSLGVATCPLGASLAEAVKFDKDLHKVSRSRIGMGTMVSITVLDPSRDHAEEAIALAFEEIERLTRLMSRFDGSTPVAYLNNHRFLKEPSPELSFVMQQSMHYHRLSDGLFDITIKPLLDVLTQSNRESQQPLPSKERIAELLKLVDATQISLTGNRIEFKRDGMGITLDGIAKGFIVDKAAGKLVEQGITHALINAGGDIRTIGDKGNNKPWVIAIEDPLKKRNYPDKVAITNRSIATSGNYEIFFDQDKVFHHILNPKTGISPATNASVSVQAPTAMEADALSTTLFVLDPVRGTRLINSLPQCQSLVVTRTMKKIKSDGWRGIRTS
jgi:thiamine biosynthesis lipoprotein